MLRVLRERERERESRELSEKAERELAERRTEPKGEI